MYKVIIKREAWHETWAISLGHSCFLLVFSIGGKTKFSFRPFSTWIRYWQLSLGGMMYRALPDPLWSSLRIYSGEYPSFKTSSAKKKLWRAKPLTLLWSTSGICGEKGIFLHSSQNAILLCPFSSGWVSDRNPGLRCLSTACGYRSNRVEDQTGFFGVCPSTLLPASYWPNHTQRYRILKRSRHRLCLQPTCIGRRQAQHQHPFVGLPSQWYLEPLEALWALVSSCPLQSYHTIDHRLLSEEGRSCL